MMTPRAIATGNLFYMFYCIQNKSITAVTYSIKARIAWYPLEQPGGNKPVAGRVRRAPASSILYSSIKPCRYPWLSRQVYQKRVNLKI